MQAGKTALQRRIFFFAAPFFRPGKCPASPSWDLAARGLSVRPQWQRVTGERKMRQTTKTTTSGPSSVNSSRTHRAAASSCPHSPRRCEPCCSGRADGMRRPSVCVASRRVRAIVNALRTAARMRGAWPAGRKLGGGLAQFYVAEECPCCDLNMAIGQDERLNKGLLLWKVCFTASATLRRAVGKLLDPPCLVGRFGEVAGGCMQQGRK